MKKYLSILLIAYKNFHIYPFDVIGLNAIYILRIVVILTLFRAIFELGGNASIAGYSLTELSWALIITQAVVTSKPRTYTEIADEIKSGTIVTYLLNPVHYVSFKFFSGFSQFLGNILPALGVGGVVGICILWFPSVTPQSILGSTFLLLGGMLVTFFSYTFIGLLAFYMEDSEGFRWIYSKFDMIFGGNILPLPFLPDAIKSIAFYSPFSAGGYTAGIIFTKFTYTSFLTFFGIQIFWAIAFIIACFTLFAAASKRLVINGG